MNRLLSRIRRAAGATKRRLAPSPEVAAWRRACRLAERTPRYTRGEIQLGPYTLQYSDLLTLCPQWDDIFVRRSLAFTTGARAPRILDCGANLGLASRSGDDLWLERVVAHACDVRDRIEPDPEWSAAYERGYERYKLLYPTLRELEETT